MRRSHYLLLFIAGLVFTLIIAWPQAAPGYMDADYYFAGGLRLAQGHGFTETYLWNYLDNPGGLPHPSHGYWFPLASILAAAGMVLTQTETFFAARLGFILVAALVPPTVAALAFTFTGKRELALASGFLGVFCGYHAPFLPTTDNFGIFMLLGALFFLLISRPGRFTPLLLGLVVGLLNLSRSDGLIWFASGLAGLFLRWRQEKSPITTSFILPSILFVTGYFIIMAPWMARNLSIWNTPLTPAGSRVLWMTRYDDTFAWPPDRVNMQNWLAAGWQSALEGRLEALKLNLVNSIAAQAGIVLAPFIPLGLWTLRDHWRARLGVLVWAGLFVAMTFIFPYAGSRGSFFHANAALQPLWWTAAPLGVDWLVAKARKRGMFTPAAPRLFRFALVMFMALLTGYLAYVSVILNDWNQFHRTYLQAEEMLVQNGAQPTDAVIVANAPGYYVANRRSAIIVPDENLESVLALAKQFNARFLILEKTYYTDPMIPVYENPTSQPGLTFLGEFDKIRIFAITP